MTLPPNFGRAVDLSSLGKPKPEAAGPMPGIEITPENLTNEFLALSKSKPVILICWSPRSPESQEVLATLGALEIAYESSWILGRVDVDAQPQVAQALQVRAVPFAVAIINEQMVPLFEQAYPEAQVRMVLDKVLTLASEQGVGEALVEQMEPEEIEAMDALEAGNFLAAEAAYKKWLARKPAENLAKLGLAQTQLLMRTEGLQLNDVIAQSMAEPSSIDLQLKAADVEMVNGGVEAAFTRLLHAVKATSGDDRTKVKNHLLNLFSLIDSSDPRLVAARKELASALF